ASAALLQPGQRIRLFSSLPDGGSEVVVEKVTIARLVDKPEGIAAESGQLVSVILSAEDAGRVAEFAGLPISFAILPNRAWRRFSGGTSCRGTRLGGLLARMRRPSRAKSERKPLVRLTG